MKNERKGFEKFSYSHFNDERLFFLIFILFEEKEFENFEINLKPSKVNQRFSPTQFSILHQFLGKLQPSSVLFLKKIEKKNSPSFNSRNNEHVIDPG